MMADDGKMMIPACPSEDDKIAVLNAMARAEQVAQSIKKWLGHLAEWAENAPLPWELHKLATRLGKLGLQFIDEVLADERQCRCENFVKMDAHLRSMLEEREEIVSILRRIDGTRQRLQ
jgi:hypothetical protein